MTQRDDDKRGLPWDVRGDNNMIVSNLVVGGNFPAINGDGNNIQRNVVMGRADNTPQIQQALKSVAATGQREVLLVIKKLYLSNPRHHLRPDQFAPQDFTNAQLEELGAPWRVWVTQDNVRVETCGVDEI